MEVERQLNKLAQTVRATRNQQRDSRMFRVPAEFVEKIGGRDLAVPRVVNEMMTLAIETLERDERFETYDRKQMDLALQRFVAACYANERHETRVFIAKYAEQLEELTAWYVITHVSVEEDLKLGDVTIRPIPAELREPRGDKWDDRGRSIATVRVSGSNHGKMLLRARRRIAHAMSALRAALPCAYDHYDNSQLRFTIGDTCGFLEEGSEHWTQYASQTHAELDLAADVISSLKLDRLALIGVADNIKEKLAITFGWLDRARMTDDSLVRALFLFFALEALLGDRSSGIKSKPLAFATALICLTEEGNFAHPSRLHFLYDDIRSAAVHGNRGFEIDDRDVNYLDEEVSNVVQHYISIVIREEVSSRKRFRKWLREHPQASDLLAWLRDNDPDEWASFNWPSK